MAPSNQRRPFKFQEFAGHSGNVRCISIGRKSCQVLATGGDDRKVNIWALGKPNALMSLTGHTSPVECTCFDAQEEVVVAGATSGTLKLWDLEQGKAIHTLLGHRSDCLSVEFHPYGAFFASGSLDTNLKVWDIRRKACIQTYKGHLRGVNVIRFSPDGKWVVSGGEDGFVKLWDLTAGKLLHEYQHDGEVTSLEFHPSELVLASGGTDRKVKLLDLDRLEQIGATPAEGSSVSQALFSPDGSSLLSVHGDYLKVWTHYPHVEAVDSTEVGWGAAVDICINASFQAVACILDQSFVQVWALNLNSLKPWAKDFQPGTPDKGTPDRGVNKAAPSPGSAEAMTTQRRAFVAAQRKAEEERVALEQSDALQDDRASRANEEAKSALHADKVSRAQEERRGEQAHADDDIEGHLIDDKENDDTATGGGLSAGGKNQILANKEKTKQAVDDVEERDLPRTRLGRKMGEGDADRSTVGAGINQTKALQAKLNSLQDMWGGMQENSSTLGKSKGWGDGVRGSTSVLAQQQDAGAGNEDQDEELPRVSSSNAESVAANVGAVRASSTGNRQDRYAEKESEPEAKFNKKLQPAADSVGWQSYTKHAAIDDEPKRAEHDEAAAAQNDPSMDEEDILDQMLRESVDVRDSLRKRQAHLKEFLRVWQAGQPVAALQGAAMMEDDSALCDVLLQVCKMPHIFTLDVFVMMLPRLCSILEADTEEYVLTAMQTIQVLVRTFSDLIQRTRSAAVPPGVDIQAEERRRKCNQIYGMLQTCSSEGSLAALRKRPGRIGPLARGVIATVQGLK